MNELFTYYLQELDRYHPEALIHHSIMTCGRLVKCTII